MWYLMGVHVCVLTSTRKRGCKDMMRYEQHEWTLPVNTCSCSLCEETLTRVQQPKIDLFFSYFVLNCG